MSITADSSSNSCRTQLTPGVAILDRREVSDPAFAVLITEGPALVVANQGASMSAEVLIESLGHIGASPKSEGEAIGHKGIGFKSVLEITIAPEIYSGLRNAVPTLAARFDPELAHATIRRASPEWSSLLAGVQGIDHDDELAAIPVLRYPHWADQPPPVVSEMADRGFDTVVRLPFDDRAAQHLGLDEKRWLSTVRDSLTDVSDQILLLLGCFSEVVLDDQIAGHRVDVKPSLEGVAERQGDGCTREVVRILRNGDFSSRWRVFRKNLPELDHLAGEIAVGIRLDDGLAHSAARSATDGVSAAPFHLFFPTRIASGLPFLLHGYFEVDAARTSFYGGSESRNKAILQQLAGLTAAAVRDAAESEDTDLVTIANLVAEAGEPEDHLARDFREGVLQQLDGLDWLPTAGEGDRTQPTRPTGMFVWEPALTRRVSTVFPAPYVVARVGLTLPDARLSDHALDLIRSASAHRNARSMGHVGEALSARSYADLGGKRRGACLHRPARSVCSA